MLFLSIQPNTIATNVVDLDVLNPQTNARYMASDVKAGFCSPHINVYDCNDVNGGNMLYNITYTDGCVNYGDQHYAFTLPSGRGLASLKVEVPFFGTDNDVVFSSSTNGSLIYANAVYTQPFFGFRFYDGIWLVFVLILTFCKTFRLCVVNWTSDFKAITDIAEQTRLKVALNIFLAYKLVLGKGGKSVSDNCSSMSNAGIIILCVFGAICILTSAMILYSKFRRD